MNYDAILAVSFGGPESSQDVLRKRNIKAICC
jgi:hypothetical protein